MFCLIAWQSKLLKKIIREIEIIANNFDLAIKIAKLLSLISILSISKNRNSNPKNNILLAKSKVIILRK